MTTEQKEAIDNLEKLSEYGLCYTINEKIIVDIETVLNLIQEQEKEIKHWKNGFERELESNRENTVELLEQDLIIRKKDKIIDLMAKQLAGLAIFDIDKEEPLILGDKENVKEYFKRKSNE